jgi:hypothetical protein
MRVPDLVNEEEEVPIAGIQMGCKHSASEEIGGERLDRI